MTPRGAALALRPLMLPPDVRIQAVADLPAALRAQVGAHADEFALTRPHARVVARVIDRAGADLLALFRRPRRIADAVVEFGGAHRADPRHVLRQAFPLLADCVHAELLVPPDSPLATPLVPSLAPGDRFEDLRAVACLAHTSDTEVYEARDRRGTRRCLKMSRGDGAPAVAAMFAREAAALGRLDGVAGPRLIRDGSASTRPHLVVEWVSGRPLLAAAAAARGAEGRRGRRHVLDLACRVVEAYEALHARGVLHGDVHPGNVLVGARGAVAIIDFGHARRLRHRAPSAQPPAGVPACFDPATAAAMLDGAPPPLPTSASEQYAVAAMLYQVFTGHPYAAFSLDHATLLRQVRDDPPRPFTSLGIAAWPSVEEVLGRALAKPPGARHASMRAFGRALRAARLPAAVPARAGGPSRRDFVDRLIGRLAAGGDLLRSGFTRAPTASVQLGAAGVAHALHRIAAARDDAQLLALAEDWVAVAARSRGRQSWYNAGEDLSVRTVGGSSLYHSRFGVHVVGAAVAHATGDVHAQVAAADRAVRAARADDPRDDLATGRAGVLLGCAMLHAQAMDDGYEAGPVLRLGRRTCTALARPLAARAPIAGDPVRANLGVAHGWAGRLYAILQWCRVASAPVPAGVPRRLDELAALAQPVGHGLRWPWRDVHGMPARFMPGWCNGSAGFVHLWALAHEALGDARYLALAERAGLDAWEAGGPPWDLCCGAAGRGYAMLRLYRATRARAWLARANRLAGLAVAGAMAPGLDAKYPTSAFRGACGVAVLVEELSRPDDARMPMFELEPWIVRAPGATR